MVLNGNHNLCVLNEISCIIEKKRGLQGFILISFSCFTCIWWELLRRSVGGQTSIPKISSGGQMSTCKISTGRQTSILKISSEGKCPGHIFNWGANVHLYFFSLGGKYPGGQTSGDQPVQLKLLL